MSKAVLISIRPKWCEKIASGAKTIEVRKSRPKIEAPFRCYIYCTMPKTKDPHQVLEIHGADGKIRKANGKVIGEFVCDRIYQYTTSNAILGADISTEDMTKGSCLAEQELHAYEYSAEPKENCIYLVGLYGWHISDLVIYDKPKELGEFTCGGNTITRPPQSWCYVEVLHE